MDKINKQTVLVTGGSRGIGRQICLDFANAGANVAYVYKENHDAAESLRCELEKIGAKNYFSRCVSVDNYDGMKSAVEAIIAKFGRLDVLVNNAGLLKVGPLAGMRQEDWKPMIMTNLNGTFVATKLALPYLIKNQGCIINISSFMAYRPVGSGQAVYCATKAGIIGMTRALADEVATLGVRVNCIAPGLIDTDMISKIGKENVDSILKKTLMRRLGNPKDISSMVLFLSSDDSKYITGQTFPIDGGAVKAQF